MDKGKFGEKLAELYLERQGYVIRQRNYQCRYGEIDLIAVKDGILCFVEVKLRSSLDFGYPCEAVNRTKQTKLKRTAYDYVQHCWQGECEMRMDILEVLMIENRPYFHHIPSAFY